MSPYKPAPASPPENQSMPKTARPAGNFKSWQWAAGWSGLALALSCLPYLLATFSAPEGWRFAGILVNPLDGHSYLAKMQQGVDGNWLFHLTYTPEPHNGAFIFTFYLLLGRVSALTGLPKIVVLHLARLLAGLGLLLMAYRFMGRVTSGRQEQRLAFAFALTASGLGWLGAAFGAFPIDLWVPEAFTPYSLYANPHFPLGMMLMLIIFDQIITTLKAERSILEAGSPFPLLWSGLAALALAMVLPFALLTVWAVLALFLSWLFIIRRRLPWLQIWPTLSAVIFAAPVIFYQYWVSVTNPALAGWSAQNLTPAPAVLDVGLGYGLVGLLALAGAAFVLRRRNQPVSGEWLALWWAVTTVALVYIPFELQRRLITGLHLPLCILAGLGLHRWLARSRLKPGYQRLVISAAITLGALGTLAVWTLPLAGLRQSPQESPTTALFFLRTEEQAAFEWLRRQAEPDAVVLASPRVGMFVPGQTGLRTFYGHPFETIQAGAKKAQVDAFFKGEISQVTPPADYIFYGPTEQALGRPQLLAALPVVFSTEQVTIYKIERE